MQAEKTNMIESPCFTCILPDCDDTSPQCPLSTNHQKLVAEQKTPAKYKSTEWRRKNPEKARAVQKRYRDKNRERVLQWQRDRRARLKQQGKK